MSGATQAPDDERVLSVHYGRSANCSSIGSVVDVLFVSGVAGTAVLAALAVLLGGRATDEPATRADGGTDAVSPEPTAPPTSGEPGE
jgi:hypothetical protein